MSVSGTLFAVATEAATAKAKQSRLMTLAIVLDALMRSVLGENQGFRRAKGSIRSRADPQLSTRGEKNGKKKCWRASRSAAVEMWCAHAAAFLSNPTSFDSLHRYRYPAAILPTATKRCTGAGSSAGKRPVQDPRVHCVRSSRTRHIVRMCGRQHGPQRSRQHVSQHRSRSF